jgi:hypothetical protein
MAALAIAAVRDATAIAAVDDVVHAAAAVRANTSLLSSNYLVTSVLVLVCGCGTLTVAG